MPGSKSWVAGPVHSKYPLPLVPWVWFLINGHIVGFSTATIFGAHVSSKSDSDPFRDAQKNVRSANMAFVHGDLVPRLGVGFSFSAGTGAFGRCSLPLSVDAICVAMDAVVVVGRCIHAHMTTCFWLVLPILWLPNGAVDIAVVVIVDVVVLVVVATDFAIVSVAVECIHGSIHTFMSGVESS